MSMKSFFASLSGIELAFLIIGVATPLVFLFLIFFCFRGRSDDVRSANNFLKRDSWKGTLFKAQVESWRQTEMTHGANCFFDIYFLIAGENQMQSAKALIPISQIHLLRRGLPIVVKKGRKNQIAVMEMGSPAGSSESPLL